MTDHLVDVAGGVDGEEDDNDMVVFVVLTICCPNFTSRQTGLNSTSSGLRVPWACSSRRDGRYQPFLHEVC